MLARLLIIPPLLALAAFGCYGFLATFEPGTHLAWRVGYAVVVALCLAGCVATWVMSGRPKT
ncbi:MAG: hypothetical protein ACPG4Q_00990 [Phycisphaeraceae bacterium]|jgi:predicted ABC-type exoprotein transport system permease subunit